MESCTTRGVRQNFQHQAYVERLETQDARYQPFARHVWALAQAFEDDKITAFINPYLKQKMNPSQPIPTILIIDDDQTI